MLERLYRIKNSKKGFTLVELIVVLVILAILLAILVPSLTKWIDKAKEKQVLVNARTVYLACQTEASEKYGTDSAFTGAKYTVSSAAVTYASSAYTVTGEVAKDIANLSDVRVNYTFSCTVDNSGNVTAFTYTQGSVTVTLNGGSLTTATSKG